MYLTKKQWIGAIIIVAIIFVLSVYVSLTATNTPDAPGYWAPSPVGSGWCTAHGIPGIPNGTRSHCPTPSERK